MSELVHELPAAAIRHTPTAPALKYGTETVSYGELGRQLDTVAAAFAGLGLARTERIAVFLEKRIETVVTMFGAAAAGCVFVPVNPLLRGRQVAHILNDCNVRVLVTSAPRLAALGDALEACHDLHTVVLVDASTRSRHGRLDVLPWVAFLEHAKAAARPHRVIDSDMAAILYTSGSTGLPKGVVLSHRNIVAGARSVAQYLENTAEDRILSLLPLSFDAGFHQLTTAFHVGALCVLMNYLLPQDAVRVAGEERITGIGGVPPLWSQLAAVSWPREAAQSVRYFSNTGGHMPRATLDKLRAIMPGAAPYLMYGLTESFRSTYLPPSEVDRRPDSIGKAIPNVEIVVVREDGTLCGPNEPGELVHRGPLVSMGYWNDRERTAERFKPAPSRPDGLMLPEPAVWSGDTVRMDEDGFLYFVGRRDEMIKTSGYRVSPTEVEEVIYQSGLVGEAVALGVPHAELGQCIVIAATPPAGRPLDAKAILDACRKQLPAYMVPQRVIERASLPRNPNGKFDRKLMAEELAKAPAEAPR